MAIQGFVFLLVIYFLESDNCRSVVRALVVRLRGDNIQYRKEDAEITPMAPAEDSDVAAERQRITRTPVEQLRTTDIVILRQLTKIYHNRLRYLVNSGIRRLILTILNSFLRQYCLICVTRGHV